MAAVSCPIIVAGGASSPSTTSSSLIGIRIIAAIARRRQNSAHRGETRPAPARDRARPACSKLRGNAWAAYRPHPHQPTPTNSSSAALAGFGAVTHMNIAERHAPARVVGCQRLKNIPLRNIQSTLLDLGRRRSQLRPRPQQAPQIRGMYFQLASRFTDIDLVTNEHLDDDLDVQMRGPCQGAPAGASVLHPFRELVHAKSPRDQN